MADPTAESGATPEPAATAGGDPPATDPTAPATGEAELGDAGKRVLSELRRQLRDTTTRLDESERTRQALEDRDKTELEKAQGRAEAADRAREQASARVAELEREMLARTAAADAGIPNHWVRLKGASEEELRADAEALADAFGRRSTSPTAAELGAGARPAGTATGHAGFNERLRRSAGRT